jgi:hypothetical protein
MKHISRTAKIQVNASPEKALPLFTAKGEELWVTGWKPTYVYPESGEPELNAVWTTKIDATTTAVWVTVDYDPQNGSASYVKWTPDRHVTRVDIQCDPDGEGRSITTVTYTRTALSEAGSSELIALTKDQYDARIASWERAINHYLEHNELLLFPH